MASFVPHNTAVADDRVRREPAILHYALVFLVVGIVAGALGLAGIAAIAARIARVLFLFGVVLLVVHFVRRRGPSPL